MARYETKTRRVHPDNEQSTISAMETFFWEVQNAQHVKTKDTHDELRGDTLYSVTETEHFVALTFRRDLDDPRARQARALEAKFDEIEASLPAIPKKEGLGCALVVCVLLTAFFGLGILIALFWIPGILAKNARIEAELPEITARRSELEEQQVRIIAECRRLREAPPPIEVAVSTPQPAALPPPPNQDDDVAFWDRIDKSDTDSLQEYLLRHPTGRFVELARTKLTRMGVQPLSAPDSGLASF